MLLMKEKLQPRHRMTVNEETINKRLIGYNKNAFTDKMFTLRQDIHSFFSKSKTTFLDVIFRLKLASNVTPKYFAESTCAIHSSRRRLF